VKHVLMIAYHYPPCFGSSGVLRTLKFSRYLAAGGWRPIILTVHPRAHPKTAPTQVSEIPEGMPVARAFALDTARHLSVGGRYSRRLARPDRWASWWLGAVPAGLRLARKYRPAVIWSTYPIATAHWIGGTLQRLTGLPWVADFRDSMTEEDYPRHPRDREAYLRVERRTVARAARLVFTAESTRTMYMKRYPDLGLERCLLIPNGYDEADFEHLAPAPPTQADPDRPLTLIHAGAIYPEERDPRPFFRALGALKASGHLTSRDLRVELRASGSESSYLPLVRELGIDDIVSLLPAIPYHEVLQACARADGLLLLQGPSCNHQIPAKVYEYLRLRRPVLALTSHEGDTAALLRETGGATIVDLMAEAALRDGIPRFVAALRSGTHPLPARSRVESYARHNQARQLASCFDEVTSAPPPLPRRALPGQPVA
jgi:glycosyltransferase involved in cell wall biosynthesis